MKLEMDLRRLKQRLLESLVTTSDPEEIKSIRAKLDRVYDELEALDDFRHDRDFQRDVERY